MRFKPYDIAYRKNLDILCQMTGFKNEDLFDLVKNFIPNSLELVGPPDSSVKKINCHSYTFGKNYLYVVKYVHDAIKNGILKEVNELEGDIIIYYLNESVNSPIIKHSGFYLGKDKVRSKWENGPVFIHNIFNVPYTYGEKVKFFKKKQNL